MQSGTSVDGIDVAVVDVTPLDGSPIPPIAMTLLHSTVLPWPERLRTEVLDAALGGNLVIGDVCRLDTLLGQEFAGAAADGIRAAGPVDLVVSHGQTVYHWSEGGRVRGSLQLGEAAWIAEATGTPVLSDLRSADIAAGGEGAPLMAVFDGAWLAESAAHAGRPLATLNLGGIANVSIVLPDGNVTAWDIGPGNGLIDAVVSRATGGAARRDEDGRLARSGRVDGDLLAELLRHPYFAVRGPKTTGRETFGLPVVDAALNLAGGAPRSLEDLVSTLTRLTARTVADALAAAHTARPERVLASGGGVHNPALMAALSDELAGHSIALQSSGEHGVDPDHKESLLFALIGFLSWHGVPCRLPATPRGRQRVLGSLIPPRPAGLPEPLRGIRGLTVNSAVSTAVGGAA